MDPVAIFVGVAALVIICLWAFTDVLDFNKDGKVDSADLDAAVDAAEAVVEKKVAEVKAKLPTAAKLKALTKAQLEELGRDFGVELDKRKTKDKMVADLKAGVKANKK